jgi:enamine deaminase RidA (YjgF/YER057c/UK114 family)
MEIIRKNIGPRMSQVVVHGNTIYLAGQVSDKPEASTAEQVRDVLGKIERLLHDAGSNKANILATTIYLADLRDFAAMNEVWDAWVEPNHTPARTTVEAKLARPTLRVEMTVVAAR